MIDKDKLNRAFKGFRKRGLMARQNFMCCSGCAGCAMADDASKMADQGRKKPLGAVFYHKQDTDRLKWGSDLYLSFGQLETSGKHGKIGLPTEEVGKIVVDECRKAGLRVEWDGSASTRIVIQPGEPEAPTIWERLQ